MSLHAVLESEWDECFARMRAGEFLSRLEARTLKPAEYRAFIGETYHNSFLNPKLMALFFMHLRSGETALEGRFLKHAAQESGHHEMALADYAALGGDAAALAVARPMPATEALAGFIAFQIQHRNPLAFLGYIHHLETLPTRVGGWAGQALLAIGVPPAGLSFLSEHAEADVIHSKWGRDYLEQFVKSEADAEAVRYGMRATCELHGRMMDAAVASCRDWTPAVPVREAAA